jgi:hypothetical protein
MSERDPILEATAIRNLKDWPRWPWLPVKRWNGSELQVGTLYADDIDLPQDKDANGPIRVFGVNVFETSMRAAVALTEGVPCPWPVLDSYENVEAMIADGWKGD